MKKIKINNIFSTVNLSQKQKPVYRPATLTQFTSQPPTMSPTLSTSISLMDVATLIILLVGFLLIAFMVTIRIETFL